MYKDLYQESRILSADPIELVQILYGHTLNMVKDARGYLAAGDIAARGRSISRALAAVGQLESTLDYEAGGTISQNLAKLYAYMRTRLLEGNIKQKDAPLAEVEGLLTTLYEAWLAIGPKAQATPVVDAMPVRSVWGEQFVGMAEPAQAWSA